MTNKWNTSTATAHTHLTANTSHTNARIHSKLATTKMPTTTLPSQAEWRDTKNWLSSSEREKMKKKCETVHRKTYASTRSIIFYCLRMFFLGWGFKKIYLLIHYYLWHRRTDACWCLCNQYNNDMQLLHSMCRWLLLLLCWPFVTCWCGFSLSFYPLLILFSDKIRKKQQLNNFLNKEIFHFDRNTNNFDKLVILLQKMQRLFTHTL